MKKSNLKLEKRFENKLINFLAITPTFIVLVPFLLFLFSVNYARSPSLFNTYSWGISVTLVSIFFLIFVFGSLNVSFPKLKKRNDLEHFLVGVVFIYFSYILFGQVIWNFLLTNVKDLTSLNPEVVTQIFPIVAIGLITFYRILKYFEEGNNNDKYIIKFRETLLGIILGGMFVSFLITIYSKGSLDLKLYDIAITNIAFISLLGLLLEIWVWAVKIQYFDQLKDKWKNLFDDLNFVESKTPQKFSETKFGKFIMSTSLFKKWNLISRINKIIIVVFIVLIFFFSLSFFSKPLIYENKSLEINSYYADLSFTTTNLYDIVYANDKSVDFLDRSYPIIQAEGNIKSLKNIDRERFEKQLINYDLLGYINVNITKSKSLFPSTVLVNASLEKVNKEMDKMSNQFLDIIGDGDILYYLYGLNITNLCIISKVIQTNILDPMFEKEKFFLFNNQSSIRYVGYYEEYHMFPMNQVLVIDSEDINISKNFKNHTWDYNVAIDNQSLITSQWNINEAYEECVSNIYS